MGQVLPWIRVMPYPPTYKNEMDMRILGWLPLADRQHYGEDWVSPNILSYGLSVAEIAESGLAVGTVRASLKRLLDSGQVIRYYDGNERFGKYVYARTR